MLDSHSPALTEALRKLLPKTFIAPEDFGNMNPIYTRPLKGRVMVHQHRIAVPKFVWRKIGSPPGAALFMDRWDLFITRGQMEVTAHHHYIGVHLPGHEFANLIKTGEYPPQCYEVIEIAGVTLLKLKNCNQFCIDAGSLQHWKDAKRRLEGG